jgi:hypothetical protein
MNTDPKHWMYGTLTVVWLAPRQEGCGGGRRRAREGVSSSRPGRWEGAAIRWNRYTRFQYRIGCRSGQAGSAPPQSHGHVP